MCSEEEINHEWERRTRSKVEFFRGAQAVRGEVRAEGRVDETVETV